MEVFIFTTEEAIELCTRTIEAWEWIEYAAPINVVQLPEIKFEVKRQEKWKSCIRVIRKGIVAKWPVQQTHSYNTEHAQAVMQAGYKVTVCPTIFKRSLEC